MKKNKYLLCGIFLSVFFLSCFAEEKSVLSRFVTSRKIVDKIVARVNGRNILLSDLKVPRIDKGAETYSLEEAVDSEVLFQKAAERKLLPTSTDVEKHIASWKEMHHLTHMTEEEFEDRLKDDGLTARQYRNQLARILAVRNLRSVEMSERIIITAREVEVYHENNPEYSDDRYLLETKVIPFQRAKTEEEAIADKEGTWIKLDWIEQSELADEMSFVDSMKEGEVSKPVKTASGYQFVKLLKKEKKHLKSIDERWGEIERTLQDEKMKKFEKKYLKELKDKAAIVYLK